MASIDSTSAPSTARTLTVIAGIYTTQSVIGALTFHAVPAVLRKAGAGLDMVGSISLFMLPWALKFLWAPWIERWRLPTDGRRRSRAVVVIGQAIAMIAVATLVGVDPASVPLLLVVALAIAAVATATVDIACDGFAIERLRSGVRGWGNVMQVGGGYAGAMIGGGLFLVLVDRAGWHWAILATAAIVGLLTLPMALTPEPGRTDGKDAAHRPSLRHALARREIRTGLMAVLVVQAGLRLSQGMTGPFLIDRGFDLAALGVVAGGAGTIASFAGTILAGLALQRFAVTLVLPSVVGLLAVMLAAFFALALHGEAPRWLLGAFLVGKAFAVGAIFVALYTAMMGWSSPLQAGVDFTLFQSADAMMAAIAGVAGGVIAQHLGYPACFGLSVALAIVATVVMRWLLRRAEGAVP
jgi:MFS transporter (putative signal transducer)